MPDSRGNSPVRFDLLVVLLVLATLAPFVPAAWQFVEHGVPDHLFTGDAATLEIRVRQAGDGAQYVGPYSRFQWSHPGPLFFYLALPVYEVFGQRGPALNVFMLLANMGVALSIVITARRLRGNAFAWLVAALLAVFELIALPFVRTGEWNPVSPILPLLLLSFLTARLALGYFGALPVFVFIASAIIQTHIGYAPEVAALSAVALVWNLPAVIQTWPEPVRRHRRLLIVTGVVTIACWALPLYQSATTVPGNLRQIVDFFAVPNDAPPQWQVVFGAVFAQLAAVPAALVRTFQSRIPVPGPMMSEAIALGQLALLLAAGKSAWQRRDAVLGVFVAVALAELVAAVVAVRGIRGGVQDYLVLWIAVPGFMTLVVAAAWIRWQHPRWPIAAAGAGVVVVGLALMSPGSREPAFRSRNEAAEQFARDVEEAIRSVKVAAPVVRIASLDVWPTAAGVVLHLRKRHVPFYVEPSWGFMFGQPLVDPGGERPRLLIGNRSLDQHALADRQLSLLASGGDVVAYLDSSGSLADHRVEEPPTLMVSSEIERDPKLAVDGVIPAEGTTWNSPQSAIFRSATASITIAVPHGESRIAGLFASVDGNDLYRVTCVGRELAWKLGVEHPDQGLVGMQIRKIVADEIAACDAVTIAPVSGDGLYSIGEIGFLR